MPVNPEDVLRRYKHIESLRTDKMETRGWLMDVLQCVSKLSNEFTLEQMYSFIDELQMKHPDNYHVPDKIRQQLQLLRDKGFIEFTARGHYRKVM